MRMTLKDVLEVVCWEVYIEVRTGNNKEYEVIDEDFADLILRSIHRGTTDIGNKSVSLITPIVANDGEYDGIAIYIK